MIDKRRTRSYATSLERGEVPMNKSFFDAVKHYPDFKMVFKEFCDVASKRLNENASLPGVSFSAGRDGASAQLQVLDHTFEISLRFLIVENAPWGVLQASLPEANKEPVRLFHTFFDEQGKVWATPDAPPDLDLLYSVEFVKTFVNRVAHEYFSHLSAKLGSHNRPPIP